MPHSYVTVCFILTIRWSMGSRAQMSVSLHESKEHDPSTCWFYRVKHSNYSSNAPRVTISFFNRKKIINGPTNYMCILYPYLRVKVAFIIEVKDQVL